MMRASNKKVFTLFYLMLISLLMTATQVHAALTIQITTGVDGAQPIAVVPFSTDQVKTALPYDLVSIINNDLARSGRFAPMPEKDLIARPHDGGTVRFGDWRLVNMDYLLVGRVRQLGDVNYEVQFQLFDVFKGEQITGISYPFVAGDTRRMAHRISDIVYEKLTGQKGAFNTRIAYVTALTAVTTNKRQYHLNIADSDGFNEQTILDSSKPLMSPSWSPDGQQLAYVSFEAKRPQIFVQQVFSGQRQRVTDFKGLNSAPVWSPDGKYLAMTLSKSGNPELYLFEIATRQLTQLTRHPAVDTEPTWSPDGSKLVFTSDRGGKPQLYMMRLSRNKPASRPRRLTFEGEYNARGVFSPDGKHIAMVHGNRGRFQIAVLDIVNNTLQVLTDSRLDESPSFAPNGSMIIYATNRDNRGVLAAVSVDGRVHQRLEVQQGDVREPAWSPLTNAQ